MGRKQEIYPYIIFSNSDANATILELNTATEIFRQNHAFPFLAPRRSNFRGAKPMCGPAQMLWVLLMVIRPTIMYGSLVWVTPMTEGLKKLNKLQRLALMQLAHFRKSTPESGLDVALGVIPLDLHVLETSIKARLTTKGKVNLNLSEAEKKKLSDYPFFKLDAIIDDQDIRGRGKASNTVAVRTSNK